MKNKFITSLVLSATLLSAQVPASAMDAQIDEVRFGGAILDIPTPDKRSYYKYNLPGVNAEVLFAPFDFGTEEYGSEGFIGEVLTPRLHVGATVALDSYSPSSLYTGLTWHHSLGEILFIESSFGATVHDGRMKPDVYSSTKQYRGLGSPLLFRESLSIGANITEDITMILQISHMSHAGLAGDNNSGQTDVALKIGKKF